jgi:hypothetical protein
MAGGVAPFYRVREAVEGSGGGAVRGMAGGASSTLVTGVEARGGRLMGGNEGEGAPVRFNSNRVRVGDGRRRAERRQLGREVEDDPVMGQTGQSGSRWLGCGWAGIGISKENWDGLPWPLGRIDGLNRRAYRKCF